MLAEIRTRVAALSIGALAVAATAPPAHALDREALARDASSALQQLVAGNEVASLLRPEAKAVLVFPRIVKAGFMFGGQMGNGALFKNGAAIDYYNSVAASYGLQAGVQVFGYALFFMNDKALSYLDKSDGWEVGVGPSIVVVDKGAGKAVTSSTVRKDIYAFIFSQEGLMAGIGIQGSKITKLDD